MSEGRFAAFSFVDKIDSVELGKSISGRYLIPETIAEFRHSLCCEAVGQCAAWSAMAALDFRFRPVAGISRAVEFFAEPKPGQTLLLEAQISRADSEAVTYDGLATIDGREIVKLHQCLGPMLPMEDFDAPGEVRARYEELIGPGAKPGMFGGVPQFDATVTGKTDGALEGKFVVPAEGEFFADHFPRKPVFPGTLFLDLCVRFAGQLVGPGAIPTGATDTKLREFMEPGVELSLKAELVSEEAGPAIVAVFLTGGKRPKRMVQIPFRLKS